MNQIPLGLELLGTTQLSPLDPWVIRRGRKLSAVFGVLASVLGAMLLFVFQGMTMLAPLIGAVLGIMAYPVVFQRFPSQIEVSLYGRSRCRAGETIPLAVGVVNRGRWRMPPIQVDIGDGLADVEIPGLAAGQTGLAVTELVAPRRGEFSEIAGLLTLRDPLRLMTGFWVVTLNCRTLVHPQVAAPLALPRTDTLDDGATPTRSPGIDLVGVRPWRHGDRRRDLHHRASARHGTLIVSERFEHLSPKQAQVVLIGTPRTDADESRLAVVAASLGQARRSGETCTAQWFDHTGIHRLDLTSEQSLLDDVARLGTLAVPNPAQLRQALAGVRGSVLVMFADEVLAGDREQLVSALTADQITPVIPRGMP